MALFEVWAPRAQRVDVRLEGGIHPLAASEGGRFHGEYPGADYTFLVDGRGPVPDPRSPWQPYGVHGVSRMVDHASFPWTDPSFQSVPLPSAVVYELHIGTFTPAGTFDGAIQRLDYLKELGITHVELMPVNEFPGDWGWGYDGVGLFAPHHSYGGPAGLKRLVDACHARGLAVIQDVVYNHLGPSGNYLSFFGPYFTDRYHTPWGEAVNLDGPQSHQVRRFFIDNALMWLRDYHMDGLRLDAIHAFMDRSAIHFLEQLAGEISGQGKFLIAESDLNDPRVVRSPERGGYGLDAQWSDDFHHALHATLTGEHIGYYEDFAGGIPQIAKALTDTFVYDGAYSRHRQRHHGRPATGIPQHRFLGYLQTHDQVGNRARGERISHLTTLGKAKIGAALVLFSPFIPMIFQGEEFAASTPFQYFTNHHDPDLAQAVSEGRRREFAAFGWRPEDVPDPQDPETFQRSKLNWEEIELSPHREMLAWYKELIQLRKSLPRMTAVDYGEDWISIRRGDYQLTCNLTDGTAGIVDL